MTDPTPEQFAEAAAWMARLRGPNRTSQFERGFHRWLDAKPEHRVAFESMTNAWEVSGRLPTPQISRTSRWEQLGYRQGFVRAILAVATLAVLAIGVVFYVHYARGLVTDIGEQRQLTLEDGSRIFLNTSTRILVRYDKSTRRIELIRGEAQFEVARNPHWPFVVHAGNQEIRALGTSFVVRYSEGTTAVTLVEGKVTVTPVAPAEPAPAEPLPKQAIALIPGQRLIVASASAAAVDEPPLEKVTAWRRGLVDFDNTPLSEAVAEMNRYSTRPITLDSAASGSIAVTGVFRAGDASSFAAALARAYDLDVNETSDAIHLKSPPR
jgi:transmembrane sensor